MLGTVPVDAEAPTVRGRKWSSRALKIGAYTVGSVAAGASLGALVGAVSGPLDIPDRTGSIGVAAIGLLYAATDAGLAKAPMLQLSRRQVPHSWRLRFSPPVSAALYGLGLGVAVATPIVTGAVYVLLAWMVANGSWVASAIVMGLFGLGRAAPVLLAGPALAASTEAQTEQMGISYGLKPVVLLFSGMMLAFFGAWELIRGAMGA